MILQNINLKDFSNYKIGGPAEYFLECSSEDNLVSELKNWNKDLPIFILGKGTNILISEEGFKGLIIHNSIKGIALNEKLLTVGAGILVSDLLKFCIENSLSGLEWAGGLPGTIGGAVRGNAGAFGGETKNSVGSVESINLDTLQKKIRTNVECEFSYRKSVYKLGIGQKEIITTVKLNLAKGDKTQIEKSINEKIDYRNQKHPMDKPSLGSTFKNVPVNDLTSFQKNELSGFVKNDPFPVIPVAKLIHLCELKGLRVGDAQISEKHPNFIVNLGNAKSTDVKELINIAKEKINEKFGIRIEEEIMYLG